MFVYIRPPSAADNSPAEPDANADVACPRSRLYVSRRQPSAYRISSPVEGTLMLDQQVRTFTASDASDLYDVSR